jgi:HEAT repeat protein
LKGPNPKLRTYALGTLIKLGKPAIGSLVQTLDDPDQYNRSRAVEALNAIGDKSAIKPLEAKLNDPSGLVRVQVAAALYGMGETNPTGKVILDALEDEDVPTRRVAARAVAEIMDDPPLKSAMKALNDTDADVRDYATQIVGKLRSAEAVQKLIKMLLEDENDRVKSSAADALGKIGKPAVKPLIELLEGTKALDLNLRLVRILGEIGDKRAVKPLEKIYKETTNPVLKDATAKALNEIP